MFASRRWRRLGAAIVLDEFLILGILPIDKTQRWVYNIHKEASEALDQKETQMTTHIINRKGNKMQLDGDLLSGDTFAAKDYIKSRLGGKWIAIHKAWQVDVTLVNKWLSTEGAEIRIDNNVEQTTVVAPKTMTHAEFSRRMNDPNSDW